MKKLTTEEFILKAKEVHGDKYDYSKSVYKTKKEPVTIICHEKDENGIEHGEFPQTPDAHTRGQGCPKCKFLKQALRLRKDINIFITLANKIHNNKYNYDKFEYVSSHIESIITCPIHGIVKQNAADHYYNEAGCPKCNKSHGEKFIELFLIENKIEYIDLYSIEINPLINPSGLANIDFYLPKYNIFIEYNGILHYKPVEHFGGEEAFKHLLERDLEIVKYCVNNKILLMIIPYTLKTQSKIYEFLENCIDALCNYNLLNLALIPIEYFYKLLELIK